MDEAAARRRENVMEGGMEMDGRRRVDKDRNRAGERQSWRDRLRDKRAVEKKDLEKQRLKRWRGRIVKQWATKELENRELEDNFSCRAGSKMDAAHGNTQLKAELTCCVSDSSPAAGAELWSHTASFK